MLYTAARYTCGIYPAYEEADVRIEMALQIEWSKYGWGVLGVSMESTAARSLDALFDCHTMDGCFERWWKRQTLFLSFRKLRLSSHMRSILCIYTLTRKPVRTLNTQPGTIRAPICSPGGLNWTAASLIFPIFSEGLISPLLWPVTSPRCSRAPP